MSLYDVRSRYKNGDITKGEYIQNMYSYHSYLKDLQKLTFENGITNLSVSVNETVATFAEDNLKFLINVPDQRNAVFEVLNFGPYEAEDSDCIFKYLKGAKVFFDVGANLGWYSVKAALRHQEMKIFAFEPIPYLFNMLQRNCELNGVNNIELMPFGLSDRSGEAEFYFSPSLSVAASMQNISERSDVQKVNCYLKTLDSVASELRVEVDFIKCDVEGAEKLVFDGGIETLRRSKPVIFCELLRKWSAKFDYHPNVVFQMLKNLGYQAFTYKNGHLDPIQEVRDDTVATNFLFLNASKHSW